MSKTAQKNEPTPMSINGEIGKGVFSNTVNIACSPREVFLDFGLVAPDGSGGTSVKAALVSRVILSKEHALEFRDVLNRSLEVYEEGKK